MSMTRKETIVNLEKLIALFHTASEQSKMVDYSKIIETLEFAAAALRSASREQVERMFPGCALCNWGGLDCVGVDGDGIYLSKPPKDEKFRFCPVCGKPLTDEAVEMVMERLEALKDGKGD